MSKRWIIRRLRHTRSLLKDEDLHYWDRHRVVHIRNRARQGWGWRWRRVLNMTTTCTRIHISTSKFRIKKWIRSIRRIFWSKMVQLLKPYRSMLPTRWGRGSPWCSFKSLRPNQLKFYQRGRNHHYSMKWAAVSICRVWRSQAQASTGTPNTAQNACQSVKYVQKDHLANQAKSTHMKTKMNCHISTKRDQIRDKTFYRSRFSVCQNNIENNRFYKYE